MSHLLIPRRVTLDLITMQRSSNCCHQKMLLRVARRSILRPGKVINQQQMQQNNDFHSSSNVCKQFVSLTRKREIPSFASIRAVHTATSPSTGTHVLLSTRWGRFTSQDDAQRQVAQLTAEERSHLEKAIEDMKKRNEEKLETEMAPPSGHQLRLCKIIIMTQELSLTSLYFYSMLSECFAIHWIWVPGQCHHDLCGK